ncbi:MAG: FAD-dependent oxidoreductase [Candidatus Thermoplasmatota archaeon]|nr:FAD-dependent oxidoreductase [Candidatus Thermoplasmatota archaeon]
MLRKTDVLVVGGGPAGSLAAVTGKSSFPEKKFVIVNDEDHSMVPCGIPYIFGTLNGVDKNLLPNERLTKAGIDLVNGELTAIDRKEKVCEFADGEKIAYDRLVLAVGSTPVVPKWLKGADLENVHVIKKEKEYLEDFFKSLADFKKIVVIGGGFIGVEISDELNKLGKDVTIVEILPHILGLAFDADLAGEIQKIVVQRGVKVRTGVGVKQILGSDKVEGILLQNSERIDADAVILSMGYRPNCGVAERSGLSTNELGFIRVDEYMRTEDPSIFAVGDCAEKRDFSTRKVSGVMLASTASTEARIAGMNLYGLSVVKTFRGTIAIFSTAIGDYGFGSAGLTETAARKEGFEIVTGMFDGVDKHPSTLPDVHRQLIKLIVARDSGAVLGGEVLSGPSAGELVNMIGLIIQNRMTIDMILSSQIGTHPLLTAPPTAYPLIKAAEDAAKKIRGV